MTLTADERAWVLETERRANENALALQNVAYMYSQLCMKACEIRGEDITFIARTQHNLAAVSLAERVLRGVERIGDI
jgi:hypothetical protein